MPKYRLLLPPYQTPDATFSNEGDIVELSKEDAAAAIAAGVLASLGDGEQAKSTPEKSTTGKPESEQNSESGQESESKAGQKSESKARQKSESA